MAIVWKQCSGNPLEGACHMVEFCLLDLVNNLSTVVDKKRFEPNPTYSYFGGVRGRDGITTPLPLPFLSQHIYITRYQTIVPLRDEQGHPLLNGLDGGGGGTTRYSTTATN